MTPDPATVLVVEDHIVTRRFLVDNLAADGFDPIAAGTLEDALRLLRTAAPKLVILDLGLPDGDGLELLRQVRLADPTGGRLDPGLPLIVLSQRTAELDRLRGFDRGCDDYLPKPFSYQELRARVRALLRRSGARHAPGMMRVGDLELDPSAHGAVLAGRELRLSKKEFALLRVLASDPERVFTREELLQTVWGFQPAARTRTLDSHAFRLRRKLGVPEMVVNVWGVGYRLLDPAVTR